jgi:hypothetical protein
MAAFSYILQITGDCQSTGSGAINLIPTGGTAPYTVEWTQPSLGEDQAVLSSPRSGLYPNTYVVRVNDSTLPTNQEFYINIPVSDGICGSVVGVSNTTCELNNGSVTGTSTSDYSSTNYFLYDNANSFISSAVTNISYVEFANLSAGTYYMIAQDLGGCTGRSESFIIESSPPFNFGLYPVPNSSCGGTPIGKVLVTGMTGVSPYTYLWSNGTTGSTITGLTEGTYSVQITDSKNCQVTQSATVTKVDPIGFGSFSATSPSCLQQNGSITLTITGGTAPYYYSASTGDVLISYSQQYTISNLTAGQYNFLVTDAGFCTLNAGTTLETPQGISSVSVNGVNSTCSSTDGSIQITVIGGTLPYTYTLVLPDGSTSAITNSQTSIIYPSLTTGTYTVAVADSSGCYYMQEVTIITENKFTISTNVVGTSCNQLNGQITVTRTTGGTEPFDFALDGVTSFIDTNLTAVTFSNVASGQHLITVTDATGCTQTATVFVTPSQQLDYSLYSTSCGGGSSGTITAFITSGTPPFTYQWSNNVASNPQQIQVSALTAGTYSVVITDASGCTLRRSTTISCATSYVSYESYVMGAELLQVQSPTKYGLLQMMNEGFADLTSGNTNCDLVTATFYAQVLVNPLGTSVSQPFFTATTLNVGPSDNLWYNTIRTILLSINGISGVTIDQLNNQITIQTSTSNFSLNGQEIIIKLNIVYDIMCLT